MRKIDVQESEKRVFSSNLHVQTDRYALQLDESNEEYNHLTKRVFYEIVQDYNIPFLITKHENGEWLVAEKELAQTPEIILFISDNLEITMRDTLSILQYLLAKKIIKIEKARELSYEEVFKRFEELNIFYNVDCVIPKQNTRQLISLKGETIFLNKINSEDYEKSSHAIKYVIDIIFYHLLRFMRRISIKNERVSGEFTGCALFFQGYEKDYSSSEELLKIEKKYQSFNVYAEKLQKLQTFEEICTLVETEEKV